METKIIAVTPMRAIMAFCQKQEISRLIQPDEFLYRIKGTP